MKKSIYLNMVMGLTACSLLQACKMDDALNATLQMSKTTNGMADTTTKMRDETNANMEKTNRAIHYQTLDVASADILKPEMTAYVSPTSTNPSSMMIPGFVFAKEATALELVEFTYLWLKEVNSTPPDLIGTEVEIKAKKDAYDKRKWEKLTALQVIAALTPQEKVEQIVDEQIMKSGRYEETAYTFLCMRYLAIQAYMLDQGLLSGEMTNPGMYEKAFEYLDQLEYIEKLPFSNQLEQRVFGMSNPDYNGITKLPEERVSYQYARLKKRMAKELKQDGAASGKGDYRTRTANIKSHVDARTSAETPKP